MPSAVERLSKRELALRLGAIAICFIGVGVVFLPWVRVWAVGATTLIDPEYIYADGTFSILSGIHAQVVFNGYHLWPGVFGGVIFFLLGGQLLATLERHRPALWWYATIVLGGLAVVILSASVAVRPPTDLEGGSVQFPKLTDEEAEFYNRLQMKYKLPGLGSAEAQFDALRREGVFDLATIRLKATQGGIKLESISRVAPWLSAGLGMCMVVFVCTALAMVRRPIAPGVSHGATGSLPAAASSARADGPISAPLGNELDTKPRFSHKAIVGFCWAPLFFVLLASTTLVTRGRTSVPISEDRVTVTSNRQDGEADSAATTETTTEPGIAKDAGRPRGPEWWQWVLIVTLFPLGLTAPFGTTILGVLATNDIRRSRGRLTGMPLALADSLLYPLLLLDGVVVGLFWLLCLVAYEAFGPGTPMSARAEWLCIAITTLLSVPACAYIDFRFVRTAWRKVGSRPTA